jgi:transketolase
MNITEQSLDDKARRVREHVLDMAARGGSFVGAAFSCVDILVCLYDSFLRIDHKNLKNLNRDYLLLSKGHAVAALYGTLIETGLLEKSSLTLSAKPGEGRLYLHPDRRLPGIEFFSGSLGHGLPLAVGMALDSKLRGYPSRVVVLSGDGELNEGSNWEALMVAKAYKLDNLLVIIDRNHFQANSRTEDLIPLEPLADKFRAFGCSTRTINGHSFEDINNTLSDIPFSIGQASVIIAETIRGKGIPSFEDRTESWFMELTESESETYKASLL